MNQIEKSFISIRYYLLGAKMHLALLALEYASTFHTGKRKDDSPEYSHQLSIAHHLRTLINHLQHPNETLAACFLHDIAEDYDVGFEEIEAKFGNLVSQAVRVLTKKHRGQKISDEEYYREIGQNCIASIIKGGDRVHNIQTMVGVFDKDKQLKYIQETEEYVLPMLKTARRLFFSQEPAYENMKLMLRNQIQLIQAIHDHQ